MKSNKPRALVPFNTGTRVHPASKGNGSYDRKVIDHDETVMAVHIDHGNSPDTYYVVRSGIRNGTETTVILEQKAGSFWLLVEELIHFDEMLPLSLPVVGIGRGSKPRFTGNFAIPLGDADLMKQYTELKKL